MDSLTTADWVMIGAVLAGPILAVQAQRALESLRDKRNGRLQIFHTLMATRAARVSQEHVQALNMIDIEFYGRRWLGTRIQTTAEKAVTNAWKNYGDHLNHRYVESELSRWLEEGDKLLAKLLFEMSRALGYDFDEVQLRRNVYSPIAHGTRELQDNAIRAGLTKILTGQDGFPVRPFPVCDAAPTAGEAPRRESAGPGNIT